MNDTDICNTYCKELFYCDLVIVCLFYEQVCHNLPTENSIKI